MLEGKDFIILSDEEVLKLYQALSDSPNLKLYSGLSDRGILTLVQKMERHLFKSEE